MPVALWSRDLPPLSQLTHGSLWRKTQLVASCLLPRVSSSLSFQPRRNGQTDRNLPRQEEFKSPDTLKIVACILLQEASKWRNRILQSQRQRIHLLDLHAWQGSDKAQYMGLKRGKHKRLRRVPSPKSAQNKTINMIQWNYDDSKILDIFYKIHHDSDTYHLPVLIASTNAPSAKTNARPDSLAILCLSNLLCWLAWHTTNIIIF